MSREPALGTRRARALLVLATAFPFYWAIVSSFTPEARLFQAPSLVPRALVLDHYRALFAEREFWVPIRNSLIVAGHHDGVLRDGRRALRLRARPAPLSRQGAAARPDPGGERVSPDLGGVAALSAASRACISSTPIRGWSCRISRSRCRSPSGCWSGSSGSCRRSSRKRRWWTARAGCARSGRSSCRSRCPGSRPRRSSRSCTAGTSSSSRCRSRSAPSARRCRWRSRCSAGSTRCRGARSSRPRSSPPRRWRSLVLAFQRRIVQGLTAGAVKG